MTQRANRYDEMSQLIFGSLEGTLDAAQAARLRSLISTQEWALKYYCEYITIYSDLKIPRDISVFSTSRESVLDPGLWQRLQEDERNAPTVQIAKAGEESEPQRDIQPASSRRKISKLPIITAIVSCAALLMILIYVYLNPRTPGTVVGLMVDTVGATWQNDAAAVRSGQDLRAGVLNLQQGLARIRFDSGASVILEGPAQVELLTSNSMYLREGKIVATVGQEAIGFVVNTPQGKILDLGTEFGIRVEPTGQSQLHVFKGEVVLYSMGNEKHLNVLQGLAKSVDQSGEVKDIPLQTTSFIRPEEMDLKLMARSGSSYYRWKAWVFDMHRDPSLVAHYFCAKDEAQPESLLNAAATGLAGHFGGQGRAAPTWVAGRWPEKSAVRFQRGKNQAIVIPPDPALASGGPITISTWVYYPNQEQMGGHLISCRQESCVYFQFSVFDSNYVYKDQQNRFEFLRLNRQDDIKTRLYSKGGVVQQAGAWYHLAVTHDMNNACFYINGKLFDSRPCTASPDASAAEIIIGTIKKNGNYILPEGDFDGVVDELMIFNRCLNAGEIGEIYESGTP